MNCEELRQNTAAYVLGALSQSEEAEFTRHAAECGEEHEVASLREVVSRLSQAAPALEPPAGLRDRIIAAAEADSDADGRSGGLISPAAVSPRSIVPSTKKRFNVRRFSATAYGAAATALIVIGALIGWAASSLNSGDQPVSLNHFHREDDGDWLRVETDLGESGMALSVGNLDPLTTQTKYRFWAMRDETWLAIGEFNTNPEGRWSGEFDFALEKGDTIAITIESDGESEAPTADPEIRSRI